MRDLHYESVSNNDQDEGVAKRSGWKQIPGCAYLFISKEHNLYCTYRYDSDRLELSKAVSKHVVDDIGLNQSHEDITDRIAQNCSVKECPFKLRLGL